MTLISLKRYLHEFARERGIGPDSVQVHFTLADGTVFVTTGLRFEIDSDRLAMVSGARQPSKALVVREEHILMAEMQLKSMRPIGFHAEQDDR